MSEYLTTDPDRQLRLRKVVERLHDGASAAEVKREFAQLIHGASAAEVAAMEQALIDSGFPVEEVQRLCEVHVEVFESALAKGKSSSRLPGHPVHTYLAENRAAALRLRALRRAARALGGPLGLPAPSGKAAKPAALEVARAALADLDRITLHFARKENQLFPWLERHGFTGPSRVMWGKHDEARAMLKEARAALDRGDARAFRATAARLSSALGRLAFMEERILFPEADRRLSEADWAAIRRGEDAIGYAWVSPGAEYDAAIAAHGAAAHGAAARGTTPMTGIPAAPAPAAGQGADGLVELNTGALPADLLDLALRALPLDLSIVGADDRVLYYSDSPERIFPRSPGVIGRDVHNCHPQKSVAIVERILSAFKAGTKDQARFWLDMGGRFIVIEYRALRDADGTYRGALEVSQDATEIRSLQGQGRLLDWKE